MDVTGKISKLTKIVYWTNAILAIPYSVSAFYKLYLNVTSQCFREYEGVLGLSIFGLIYVIFYCFFI